MMRLRKHPRLYLTQGHYSRLNEKVSHPVARKARRNLRLLAEQYLDNEVIELDPAVHNAHLIRARKMQSKVVTLLAEYKRTGKAAYREALLRDVESISEWEYWSWLAMRKGDPRPEAIFDLSYGENSATLALVFDALHDELSAPERELFVETARTRSLKPFLHWMRAAEKPKYFKHPHTNHNTVCCGGAGMLALAMGELCEESAMVLNFVEESVAPFFEALGNDGGWPEGIGYWNYGMRYGFMYLLSWEQSTGKEHPLLCLPGTEATLQFPLLFSPHGVPCSFGDVNRFAVKPFHYAAAERLGADEVLAELDRRVMTKPVPATTDGPWPDDAELALLHSGETREGRLDGWKNHCFVDGLEWACFADRLPRSNLYISVRGGTTEVPHAHRDLMSFFVVVGDEKLIENVGVDDYMDTTFSKYRFDLYETSSHSKNTVFINGVSIEDKVKVDSQLIRRRGAVGLRMDATEAMGSIRYGPMATFCGRAVLLVRNRGILIIDRVVAAHPALVESRLHTFCKTTFSRTGARIRGKKHQLQVAFAATQDFRLKPGMGIPSHPQRWPDTMIRCVTEQKVMSSTIACLLLPDGEAGVALAERGRFTTVTLSGDVSARLRFETDSLAF